MNKNSNNINKSKNKYRNKYNNLNLCQLVKIFVLVLFINRNNIKI